MAAYPLELRAGTVRMAVELFGNGEHGTGFEAIRMVAPQPRFGSADGGQVSASG